MTSILKVDTIQDADGNNIINESSNTITIGASGDTLQASSGTTNNLGISEIDQWRLSADLSITTLNTLTNITANWERNDNTGFGRVGTGMTESSGTFTFPSTGIYLITTTFVFYSATGGSEYNRMSINTTTNDSTYTEQDECSVATSTTPKRNSTSSSFVFDVTDTSQCKVRFYYYVQGNITLSGSSSKNRTFVTFTRIGDT
tara:strand:- start:29 stop:634 length:606 start_codon:yes stop_codon:yes gene_type:complete